MNDNHNRLREDLLGLAALLQCLPKEDFNELANDKRFHEFYYGHKEEIAQFIVRSYRLDQGGRNTKSQSVQGATVIDRENPHVGVEPLQSQVDNKIMSKADIEDSILTTIEGVTGYKRVKIGPEMDFESDLGIDSSMQLEIFSELGEKFKLDIDPEFASDYHVTLAKVVDKVNSLVRG